MANQGRQNEGYFPDGTVISVTKRGLDVIHDPLLNKGTGFSDRERDELGIRGLVPPRFLRIEEQEKQILENYHRKADTMEKYIYLEALHDRNETLYYRVLLDNLEEMTPIVYTPTVGMACQRFAHIFRRARGMYFSSSDRGKFREMIDNFPQDEIDIIVVTDGSRVLGLGDLGANGMGIPIGKLSLYVACAGIHPGKTLPVVLDVGTNNEELLHDPLYLGKRHPRLTGDEYYEMVDEFVMYARERWPIALFQFEDFSNDHAFALLAKYRNRFLCFNDDIQGTGAVALAGILKGLSITRGELCEQRFVFLGAGSAAIGIADMIVAAMDEEGLAPEEARKRLWFLDSKGLITTQRADDLIKYKVPYERTDEYLPTLLDVVKKVKPTVLIGLSGRPGTFTKEVVKEMNMHTEIPIIFPLSNPTSKAECTAAQAYEWTQGRAVFASGSPFEPVYYNGRRYVPSQGNNMFVFPGVGLGVIVCGSWKVTDTMFYAAAKTLANMVTDDALAEGRVYPELTNIREISANIAAAVCKVAYSENLATVPRPGDILDFVKSKMFQPHYVPYKAT